MKMRSRRTRACRTPCSPNTAGVNLTSWIKTNGTMPAQRREAIVTQSTDPVLVPVVEGSEIAELNRPKRTDFPSMFHQPESAVGLVGADSVKRDCRFCSAVAATPCETSTIAIAGDSHPCRMLPTFAEHQYQTDGIKSSRKISKLVDETVGVCQRDEPSWHEGAAAVVPQVLIAFLRREGPNGDRLVAPWSVWA